MNLKFIYRKSFYVLMYLTLYSSFSNAQQLTDLKIKGAYTGQALDLILLDLKITHRLIFEYNEEDIKDIRITQSFPKSSLDVALSIILRGTGLAYSLQPPQTVLIFKGKNAEITEPTFSMYKPDKFNLRVSGTIIDRNTGESLPYATVFVLGTTNGTHSNIDGYFTLHNVPSDTAVLEVQYLGYHTRHFRLTPLITGGRLVIDLQVQGQQLAEVIVTAEKEDQLLKASSGISRIGVTPAALATLPSYGEKDIFRSLQLLPGISGSNESTSGLYVRGGTPDQNLILFDGFTVYHVEHLFGFFSAFNSNAIKDVQLLKGGFDAKYGGRLSSVVELTGKDGNNEFLNAGFGVSLLSLNGFLEAPLANHKGTFLLAARRSFQSNFYSNIFDSFTQANRDANGTEQPMGNSGGRFGMQQVQPNTFFYDLNAKVTYRPGPNDILSISFYSGQDNLDNSRKADNSVFGGRQINFNFNRYSTDLTNWGNWGSSLKWSRRWSDNFYTNANLSYSNYYSERDRSTTTTVTRTDSTFTNKNGTYELNDLQDFSIKLDNEWELSQYNQLEFGLQATYNDIFYEFTQNDTLTVINRLNKGATTSIYVQDKITFSDKLILKGGLRASHYSLTGAFYLEPRFNATYLFNDRIKFKAAWGLYNQFANRIVREDIQQGSRDFWLLADDQKVPVSHATHYIAGACYETPVFLFDLEAYYKNLNGLSEYSTRFVPVGFGTDRSLNYEEFFYKGTGLAKGLELLAQKKTGKLTGWIAYTLGQVKYDFPAFGEKTFFANQDQTHEFKVVGNYKMGRFTLSGTMIYATGRPYTAPTGYYEVPLLDGRIADFFEVSGKNSFRLPDYHRIDISGTYDLNLGNSRASLGLSLFNLYNRRNVWYKEYDVIEGELLETNVSMLGLTPSLFLNWSWR